MRPRPPSPITVTSFAADRWFRAQGLPTFVPWRRWFHDIVPRSAPLIAATSVYWTLAGDGIDDFSFALHLLVETKDGTGLAFAILAALLTSLVLAWAGFAVVRVTLRHLRGVRRTAAAMVVIALCAAGVMLEGGVTEGAPAAPVAESLSIVAGSVLLVAFGGGALLSWATRLAARNLAAIGHMATIALPVILMLVLFAFFSVEVWQMASVLSWSALGLLALVVAALAGAVVLQVSATEVDPATLALTVDEERDLLRGTPAEGRPASTDPASTVGRPQRINMLLAMTLAHLVQAAVFALLLAVLLVLIGAIAVPPDLAQTWLGDPMSVHALVVQPLVVQGVALPLTVNLLKAATLVAIVSALPFVFSAVSESRYRARFSEPIVADMRRAILVRAALSDSERIG
ncbi:hypothetical protein [Microbacterium sp. NPDC055599]